MGDATLQNFVTAALNCRPGVVMTSLASLPVKGQYAAGMGLTAAVGSPAGVAAGQCGDRRHDVGGGRKNSIGVTDAQ